MREKGINKFILICENVLNFHGSDDCYYEEWYEDVKDDDGWICFLNTLDHVTEEMNSTCIQHYVHLGEEFNELDWRVLKPNLLFKMIEKKING
jgi:hypothetical protein